MRRGHLQSRLSIAGRHHRITMLVESLAKELCHTMFVFDDEDAHLCCIYQRNRKVQEKTARSGQIHHRFIAEERRAQP